MTAYKDDVLKESSRVLDYILKQELSEDEKDRIISDSIDNFNEHVNPGWLEYRKSVSTDAAFVEWEDSQETFKDIHGNEFIDCLGGFGVYTAGHPTPEMGWAVSKGLFKRGVMTGGTLNNAKVNRIEPPGIISYETIDTIIEKLDETLSEVEKEFDVK